MWDENSTTGNTENNLKSLPREEKRNMGSQLMAEKGSRESLYLNGGNNDSMFMHWWERSSIENKTNRTGELQCHVLERARWMRSGDQVKRLALARGMGNREAAVAPAHRKADRWVGMAVRSHRSSPPVASASSGKREVRPSAENEDGKEVLQL